MGDFKTLKAAKSGAICAACGKAFRRIDPTPLRFSPQGGSALRQGLRPYRTLRSRHAPRAES
jgi:hypothetical protein